MSKPGKPRYEFLNGLLPLVVLVNHEPLAIEDIGPVFDHFRDLVRRKIKYVSLSDARSVTASTDARTRKALGEASKRIDADAQLWSLGNGVVVSSTIVRGALTAIEWISQPTRPMVYFSSLPAGIDWAIAKIEGAGLEVTKAIRMYRETAG